MKLIKYLFFAAILIIASSCSNLKRTVSSPDQASTVKLAGSEVDEKEYDLIIIDPGFESWFIKNRKPKSYYTNEMLATKNWNYVQKWNSKVRNGQYQMMNPNNPFEQEIDYQPNIDYGMDVNYKLYYYFKFVENTFGKF